jgi:hypothetical protein
MPRTMIQIEDEAKTVLLIIKGATTLGKYTASKCKRCSHVP